MTKRSQVVRLPGKGFFRGKSFIVYEHGVFFSLIMVTSRRSLFLGCQSLFIVITQIKYGIRGDRVILLLVGTSLHSLYATSKYQVSINEGKLEKMELNIIPRSMESPIPGIGKEFSFLFLWN